MTIALIDTDHVSWRCAGSCEPTKAKPFLETKEDAITRSDLLMHRILHTLGSPLYEAYLSGTGNWRKAIYPEYKANRIGRPVPTYLEDVREFLITEWKAKLVNDIEVDDMCGIRLTEEGDNGVCVSLDKDLLTIPGKHYNFVTEQYSTISPLDGMRRFYSMLITGDSSDNIPSFDGKFRTAVPKFVQKLLDPIQEMVEEAIMYEYCKEVWNGNEDLMHRNAKCLFIQNKEGAQWQVPGQKQGDDLSS